MPQQIQLGVETYFSPDDDTQGTFLSFLQQAKKSIHIAIYGFHLPQAVDVLMAKVKEGIPIALVMDSSQAHGHYEAPEVQQLVNSGCDVTIGTSEKHAIMHHKFAVVDGLHVLAGSWNFSNSASKEDNYLQVVTNGDLADLFLTKWEEMREWMRTHEPQLQPTKEATK